MYAVDRAKHLTADLRPVDRGDETRRLLVQTPGLEERRADMVEGFRTCLSLLANQIGSLRCTRVQGRESDVMLG